MTGGCWWSRDIAAVHQQHFFSFQLALPNGRAEEKKFVEDSAARPVCRMKKLMKLIYEWSMKGWLFRNLNLVCFFLLLWLVGYGRCQRQGLRQEKKTEEKKQIKFNEGRKISLWVKWMNGAPSHSTKRNFFNY